MAQTRNLCHVLPSIAAGDQDYGLNHHKSSTKRRAPNTPAHSSGRKLWTVRNRSISLRSRLPWLDAPQQLRSESQTKLLPMTDVRPTTKEGLTASLHDYHGQINSVDVHDPLSPRVDTVSRHLQPSSSQNAPLMKTSPAHFSFNGNSITLPMTPPFVGDMSPRTEETPVLDATPRKRSLIESIYTSKGPSSPILCPDTVDTLPHFDTSPLTKAIQHLECLMEEAVCLVNEAADNGHSSEAEGIVDHGKKIIQASKATATDMATSSLEQGDFLADSSVSDLSLDDSDRPYSKTPSHLYNPSFSDPIIRDFAYPRQNEHTAYISRSPLLSQTISGVNPLRNRNRSLQVAEDKHQEWQEWRQPRYNTYFNDAWQPNLDSKDPKSRKVSIAPIPWNEKMNRKHNSHFQLCRNKDTFRDLEKAELMRDGGSGGGQFHQRWTLGHAKDEPIARKWSPIRKRISAIVVCINTAMVGYAIGDYAGMVPRIQFQLADQAHDVLLGNVYLFLGMAITTLFCWPLPLLHGRRPYILISLGLAIPLQFPQAILVSQVRPPVVLGFEFSLLCCRFVTGLLLGLTNINDFAMLLDLFGASLQSERPHQENVTYDDPRREGGGIGVWLGIWAWCWVGSVSVGFMSGAGIINSLNPQWGFYISTGLMICAMVLNIMAPETRHSALRRTLRELKHTGREAEFAKRKIARGEIKLHLDDQGPRYWIQEVWAGVILMKRMFFQRGFCVVSLYLGWMYGQNILVIVLLGALLSRDYHLPSRYVGLGVLSIAIGALLAVPMTYAGFFSRARKQGPRTDSMTFEPQVIWTSHMVRRIVFMLMLPIAGAIYTITSQGHNIHYMVPIVFAGAIGFFQSLAVAECYGLIMETFDTSDLQPGVNSRHRLQSLAENVKNRRTSYSSFPRVSAGIFLTQSLGFLFAAAATGVGGVMTREIGAQYSTGVTAGILMFLAVLITGVLFRFKSVQVVPNHAFGTRVGTYEITPEREDVDWKPVVIGNPSGKVRRMSLLELGKLSRWTEIRKLNKLM